jgi:hypothetical protein
MFFHDQRFAKDVRFRYYALNRIMRMQVSSNSSICVNKNEIKDHSIEGLKKKIEEEPNFIKRI